ncbi:MAG: hypothetical protein ACXWUG_07140 [Polyangiales bacterium]
MPRQEVRCPKCNLRMPSIRLGSVRCPICDTLVALPAVEAEERAAPSEPERESYGWLKNIGLLVAFLVATYFYIRGETDQLDIPKLPTLPVQFPHLPEPITHPDASPEECARVRATGGECASYSTIRTCDDAGVMTEELCGLGAWPCVRDGCGPGVRCCVPGTFDAAVTDPASLRSPIGAE